MNRRRRNICMRDPGKKFKDFFSHSVKNEPTLYLYTLQNRMAFTIILLIIIPDLGKLPNSGVHLKTLALLVFFIHCLSDIMNCLAGTTGLDSFLKAYKASETNGLFS